MTSYIQPEDLIGNGTVAPGTKANVVLVSYEPFQSKSGKTIPKHKGKDADTGAEYEFVGFKFHDAFKGLLPAGATQEEIDRLIVPEITVVEVECLENGSQYPDYVLSIKSAPQAAGAPATAPF
jgi:hypothetical protein